MDFVKNVINVSLIDLNIQEIIKNPYLTLIWSK